MWMYNCYKVYKKPKLLYFPNKYWKKELEICSFCVERMNDWLKLNTDGWWLAGGGARVWQGAGGGLPHPYLSLLQRRGSSPGSESLLLGESASQEIYLKNQKRSWAQPLFGFVSEIFDMQNLITSQKKPQLHKPYCTCGSMKLIFTWQIAVFVF